MPNSIALREADPREKISADGNFKTCQASRWRAAPCHPMATRNSGLCPGLGGTESGTCWGYYGERNGQLILHHKGVAGILPATRWRRASFFAADSRLCDSTTILSAMPASLLMTRAMRVRPMQKSHKSR